MAERVPITAEDILNEDAYEARMHLLLPGNEYTSIHHLVHDYTPDAVMSEIDRSQLGGFPMWVDFFSYTRISSPKDANGIRPSVLRKRIGELAVSTYPDRLQSYPDVLEQEIMNPFMNLWLGVYALDRSRRWDGSLSHPIHPIRALYQHNDFIRIEDVKSAKYTDEQNQQAYFKYLVRAAIDWYPPTESVDQLAIQTK